jgi:tetratricopeptide (TPR) repeat protein
LGYFLAAQYEDSGAFEKAGSIYEELLKKTPTFTGYRGLVSCDLHLKKFDALLATLGEAQDKAGIIEALGDDVTKIVKDGDALKKLFEISRKRAAANPEALTRGESFAAGVLASEAKDWTVAEEFFTYAVKADPPTCGETYLVWGLGLLLDERPADAAKVFERAIEHSANRLELASFHFYLSGALAMDNRIDDALAAAREAAKLKPESTTYLARPGWVLTAGKRYEAACDFYRELMKKLETDFSSEELREGLKEIRLACSGVCVMLGRNDEAEQQLDLVLDEYPEDPGAMNDLGYLWADRNEHLGRASRMLHKAVEAEPENASFRDSLGWLFYRQGKYAEAATELQKALEKQQDGAIYDHLGDVYEKLGEKAKAKEHWQNASKAYEKEKDEEKRKSVEKKLGSVRK